MKVLFYSSRDYDREFFQFSNQSYQHQLRFIEASLSLETVDRVQDENAICVFVNDVLDRETVFKLSAAGIKLVALRCAGYDNVDLQAAHEAGLRLVHVPAYSPNAVAEHSLALMLALNRKIPQARERLKKGDFSLDGLLGFDFAGRTLGIVGTGRIGSIVARIALAMGMKVLACDRYENPDCQKMGVVYVPLDRLYKEADVISLHCPLSPDTNHLINRDSIKKMKPGVMLINTSRGAVLDSCAVIEGLESGQIAYLGMDVYEYESKLFFRDLSCAVIDDDIFKTLASHPNVLMTAHQAFFTSDALKKIADTSLQSLSQFEQGQTLENEIPWSG